MKILGVSIHHIIIMVSVGSGADDEDIRGQYSSHYYHGQCWVRS